MHLSIYHTTEGGIAEIVLGVSRGTGITDSCCRS